MAILTVYTRLLDQVLEGARIIDMGSTKTCQCFVLPYDSVDKVGKDYLKGKFAFYILLGKGEGFNYSPAYIGQTNDFTTRVVDHKQKKEWWNTALVFVSKADEIYNSEVLYLEYLGWKQATEANRCTIMNSKPIKEPRLSEDKKNDMELFFDEIKFLTKFYGCKIFEPSEDTLPDFKGIFETFIVEVKKRDIKACIQYFPYIIRGKYHFRYRNKLQ